MGPQVPCEGVFGALSFPTHPHQGGWGCPAFPRHVAVPLSIPPGSLLAEEVVAVRFRPCRRRWVSQISPRCCRCVMLRSRPGPRSLQG